MSSQLSILLAALVLCSSPAAGEPAGSQQPNVLLIAVDDLRPQLRCYGHDEMVTPQLDRLAAESRLFQRHYVQVPTCGASRYALLTGRRPSQTKALNNGAFAKLSRTRTEQPQTMPEHFRRQGYTTVCIGKISHQPDGRVYTYQGQGDGRVEVPMAWSDLKTPYGKWKYGWGSFFGYADGQGRTFHPHPTPTEAADVSDEGYPDGLIAQAALQQLGKLNEDDKPFFLAVGFYKPHLPFNAPKKYWDLYDPKTLPLAPQPKPPVSPTVRNWHSSGEMFRYRHPPEHDRVSKIDDDYARHLRHGYCACVSYVDAQIGKVLDELERLGLKENTIVVVWGDHGWHLGDHGIWGKHTTFERSLRSTLIIRTPEMPHAGVGTNALVETLDLYPTLVDLCGLPAVTGLSGTSLRVVLEDPEHPGKDVALSYWRRTRSARTARWRLTQQPARAESQGQLELYDLQSDPRELRNVAKANHEIVEQLLEHLEHGLPKLIDR